MSDLDNGIIDRLALCWQNGDINAREAIVSRLKPVVSRMARTKYHKNRSKLAAIGDYENEAFVAIMTSMHKWDGKMPFVSYAIGRARYAMLDISYQYNNFITTNTTTKTVASINAKLKEKLSRDPTLQEIHEVEPKYSVDLIRDALNAVSYPLHLDQVGNSEDESEAIVDHSLWTIDTYFQDDEELSDKEIEEKKHLYFLLSGLENQKTKKVLMSYIEHEGHFPTIAEEFGYTLNEAEKMIKGMIKNLSELDTNSPAFLERIRRNKIYDQIREDPDLLDILAPRARLYMEAALDDPSMVAIGKQYDVKYQAIRHSLENSYRKIENHYISHEIEQ